MLVGLARVGEGVRRVDVRTHPTSPHALEHLPIQRRSLSTSSHMCPRLTPKAPWLAFMSGTGWNRGISAAVLASCNVPRRPWLLESAETPYIPSRPMGRSTLRNRRKLPLPSGSITSSTPRSSVSADLAGPVTSAVADGVAKPPSREDDVLAGAGRADGARPHPFASEDIGSGQQQTVRHADLTLGDFDRKVCPGVEGDPPQSSGRSMQPGPDICSGRGVPTAWSVTSGGDVSSPGAWTGVVEVEPEVVSSSEGGGHARSPG